MNIETLRIFCDVVQHQSFSRGAKINDVSQSAATQSVHRVEEHFGVQLVDRSKRPFVLTPEGQACYEGFREVLELYDSVEARVRSLRMEISGLVRVAAIYSVGLHDMSRCMQDFMRRYPKAKVRLEYLRPNKVYDAVLNAEVDLGIVSYPAASPDLNVIPLRSERMVVVCPPSHPLASHEAVTAEQLQGMDFVGFDRDLSIRKEIDRHLRQRSVNIRVVMEFDNIETIKQAVQIGAGVSILPEPTVRDEVRSGIAGGGSADRARTAPADRHHPPPAEGVHAHGGQVRRAAAAGAEPAAGGDADARPGSPGLLPAVGQGGLRAARHPAGRSGGRGRPGARSALRRRRALRQVPRDRRRRRRPSRRPSNAIGSRPRNFTPGWRLACQSAVRGPTEVEIPPAVAGCGRAQDPRRMPRGDGRRDRPTIRPCESATSNFRRPRAATICPTCCGWSGRWRPGRWKSTCRCCANCPPGCAQADFRGTAVLADRRLLDFEPGNTEADAFAVAVDSAPPRWSPRCWTWAPAANGRSTPG